MTFLDFASIIGLILGMVLVVFGIMTGEDGAAALGNFYNLPSILITFGGAFSAVCVMAPNLSTYISNIKSIGLIMKVLPSNETETIRTIIDLANVARKEGLLAVEEAANNVEDEFLKKGILLIVDGTDPELVRNIMETELNCIDNRHRKIIGFWENLGAMGPAWGMIGTLIGLINMLKNMGTDVNAIGPNMATALITTFYGSVLANWICTPVCNKLKQKNEAEIMMREIMVEGLLSIQAGENPRVIEEKLKSFLSPSKRNEMKEEGGENLG